MDQPAQRPPDLLRAILPWMLALFVIPVFASGFGAWVERGWDREARVAFLTYARENSQSAEELAIEERAIGALSMAEVCAGDPQRAELREKLQDGCGDYDQIRWMRQGAAASIGVGVLTLLVCGAAVLASFRSRSAQIPAFWLAWNWLRLSSAFQVVAQGALLVALSFWLTAYFMGVYVIKLIAVAAIGAIVAVGVLLKAIFAPISLEIEVEGKDIAEQEAPEFWARLRALAAQIETAPPDRVIGGIDDNFFVTEVPVIADGERTHKRTLFISLSLLRALSTEEAEAILCHELAHFSGGDTAHTLRLAPMVERYRRYLQGLSEGLSLPIFYLMRAFYALFQWSFAQTSRERELRADQIAAAHTSAEAVTTSLIKVSAYAAWRGQVERRLFEQEGAISDLSLAERVRAGFAAFASSPDLSKQIGRPPHPMDSHPPNEERFASLQQPISTEAWPEILTRPTSGWYARIPPAAKIEAALWQDYEARFARNHEIKRAFSLQPDTPEARALILRYFPDLPFERRADPPALLTFEHLVLPDQPPILLIRIDKMALSDDIFRGQTLTITAGGQHHKLYLKQLKAPDLFLQKLNLYYQRARVAAGKR